MLAVEAAGVAGGEIQVREGEILDDGDVRAAQHLVIEREVRARGHDMSPALRAALVDVRADAALKASGQRAQLQLAAFLEDLFGFVQADVVALAEVVAEVVLSALFGHLMDPRRLGGGIDQRRVDAALFRLTDETGDAGAEAVAVLVEDVLIFRLQQVFEVVPVGRGNVDADLVQRVEPFGEKPGRKAAGIAPDLREIALIVFDDPVDHIEGAEILALPRIVADHGGQERVGIGRIDAGADEDAFLGKTDVIHGR